MSLLSKSHPRILAVVLAVFCVTAPRRARAQETSEATPRVHRLLASAGADWILATRMDYGEVLDFTPNVHAAYQYRAFRHLDVGGGLSGYLWTQTNGGPIFVPHVTARVFVPFTSTRDAVELGFSVRVGAAIGHYHKGIRNDPGHDPTHIGFALTLGPDFRVPLYGSTSLLFSAEIGGLGAEKSSIDWYSPVACVGGAAGIATAF